MGQRLNIEIIENGKVLANSYYHWSGYTSSSLELAQEILNNIKNLSYEDRVVNAIKLLEITGAGMADDEMNYAMSNITDFEKYGFKPTEGRNDGLISISKNGIETTERWEEARVIVDLTSRIINFGAAWNQTKEQYEEDYEKECDYPIHDINLSVIPFDSFSDIKELITGLIKKRIYGFRLSDDKICSFIE